MTSDYANLSQFFYGDIWKHFYAHQLASPNTVEQICIFWLHGTLQIVRY